MNKEQLELDFEKHRQEIPVEDRMPSRTEIHGKNKYDRRAPMKLITILLAIFALIPIIFLVYVLAVADPPTISDEESGNKAEVSSQRKH